MEQDRLGDGADVTAVTVRCGVTHVPQLAGQEVLGTRLAIEGIIRTALGELLVAEPSDSTRTRVIAQVVTLQVGVGPHGDGAVRIPLEARLFRQVERVVRSYVISQE